MTATPTHWRFFLTEGTESPSYSGSEIGGKDFAPEPTPDVHVWLHTLTVLDRELPGRMLDVGRVVANLAVAGGSENPSYSGSELGTKDFAVLEATLADLMAAGGIKSKKQVNEGMADLQKAKYLVRLNPDAPSRHTAAYALTIPPGFTPEGIAWNIEEKKARRAEAVEAAGGSARWPQWYQDAWLTHRRFKGSGQWDSDFWTAWADRRGAVRNVKGAWVDTSTGEVLAA